MANTLTLTGLTELIYNARDQVANEPTGFVQSVLVNTGSEGVSIGGTVKSHVTGAPTLNTSYTPAMTPPNADDQTITVEELTIGQAARVNIPMVGEVWKQIGNTSGTEAVQRDLIAQAIRSMRNAIEAHLGTVIYKGASRAYGTAGTTPFASTLADANNIRKILADNGCPVEDGMTSLVVNTTAGVNLRNLTQLQKVNEAGDGGSLLRRGELLNLFGLSIKESAGIASHTKGTLGGSPTTTNAGHALAATTINLASAGTGTVVAGDVATFASENAGIGYVVKTGDSDVSDGGTLVLNKPGLRVAIGASARAVSIAANYTANVAFHKNAVELVIRPPAIPAQGDLASDRMVVADPKTGLVFTASYYPGYGMGNLELVCLYQAKVWKSEFVATLLG